MSKIIRPILIMLLCISISIYAQEKIPVGNNQKFVEFLDNSLENSVVNAKARQIFYQRSWDYWMKNLLDYNKNSEKYKKALSLFHQNQEKFKQEVSLKINRYERDIENFRRFDNSNKPAANAVLFVGSSSIRYWDTKKSFPELPVINRGFGGASLPEILHYYDDVIKKYLPSIIVIYCDIDIENGKSPSVTVNNFKELVNKIEKDLPQTQILLLSMKPVLVDDFLGKDVRKNKIMTNKMLNEYADSEKNVHYVDITKTMFKSDGHLRSDIFLSDGMHLNQLGYTLWNPVIKSEIMGLMK
ncbi:MAG: GDSL-type esterase/lipase family protein [Ostreibacterium sp.]